MYALEQRLGGKSQSLAADIQADLDKLLWADLLILNFLIFWFSAPALLKVWIDRVLVSGIWYGGKCFYDEGGLAGKQALLTVTLGGRLGRARFKGRRRTCCGRSCAVRWRTSGSMC